MAVSHPLPSQIRAARALLDSTLVELAQAARVSVSCVIRAERRGPVSLPAVDEALITDALEATGIVFVTEKGGAVGAMLALGSAAEPNVETV